MDRNLVTESERDLGGIKSGGCGDGMHCTVVNKDHGGDLKFSSNIAVLTVDIRNTVFAKTLVLTTLYF